MLEFENTIHIEQPIEDIFSFLANFENVPKWNYYVLQVKKLSPGPIGVGTTFHQVRKTDEQTFILQEYEPEKRIVAKTTPESSPQLEMHFIFERDSKGTNVIDRWFLETGQPALLEKLAGGKIKTAVAENLGKLKTLLEEGEVTLQDGKRMTKE